MCNPYKIVAVAVAVVVAVVVVVVVVAVNFFESGIKIL